MKRCMIPSRCLSMHIECDMRQMCVCLCACMYSQVAVGAYFTAHMALIPAVLTAWMWLNSAIANIIQVCIWNSLDAWHKLPAAFSTDIHTHTLRSSGSSSGARQTVLFCFFFWFAHTLTHRERGHDRFKIEFGSWILQFHSHILPKCHLILMVSSTIIPMECVARVRHTHTRCTAATVYLATAATFTSKSE